MALSSELLELARHLKQERLFIQSEKEQLQKLNEDVTKTAEKLYHESWIARQQRLNLGQLTVMSRDVSPAAFCLRANILDTVCFIDGYKHLSYHESKYADFLQALRTNSSLIASCLVLGESKSYENLQNIVNIVMSALYANCTMQQDESYVLEILQSLIQLQLVAAENPRRLLRRGSCMFSMVFKWFTENFFSAKLFLTSALHKPIMQLLMEDEWFYDVDPDKALERFPKQEQLRRFGAENTEEHKEKLKNYREFVINKLVVLTQRFITSIKNSMYCFPQSLLWLLSQIYHGVSKGGRIENEEARAMCADILFAIFICPAICDPEPHGLTSDIPVSYVARHNLMQVAQILQVLAISKWEEIDGKVKDLYGRFEKNCMSSLLDAMLQRVSDKIPRQCQVVPGLTRAAVLITPSELSMLVNFLRHIMTNLEEDNPNKKTLEELIGELPQLPTPSTSNHSGSSTPNPTPPGTPLTGHKRKGLKKKSLISHEEILQAHVTEEEIVKKEEDVLVICIESVGDCPGLLSEEKVLSLDPARGQHRGKADNLPGFDGNGSEIIEKRTRFSISHDQDSIGGTSDYLEAISEAASVRSMGSVNLDDNEDDDESLSDMVSANVSGRGTPNISGRDTPLSQAGSQADNSGEPRQDLDYPGLPVTVQRPGRADVPDRFGKFDIKTELERTDEMKSTVSDTWSTDVLASDSEPPDISQLERLQEVLEDRSNLLGIREVSEVFEDASESAWSTDVLASDTSERQENRLAELETDEALVTSTSTQEEQDEIEANQELNGTLGSNPQPRVSISSEGQDSDVQISITSDDYPPGFSAATDGDRRQRGHSMGEHTEQTGFLVDNMVANLSLNSQSEQATSDYPVQSDAAINAMQLSNALSLFDPLHRNDKQELNHSDNTSAQLPETDFFTRSAENTNSVNLSDGSMNMELLGDSTAEPPHRLSDSGYCERNSADLLTGDGFVPGSNSNAVNAGHVSESVNINGTVNQNFNVQNSNDLIAAGDPSAGDDNRDSIGSFRDSGMSLREHANSISSGASTDTGGSKASGDSPIPKKDTSRGAIPKTFKSSRHEKDDGESDRTEKGKKPSMFIRNFKERFKGAKRKTGKTPEKEDLPVPITLTLPRDIPVDKGVASNDRGVKSTSLPSSIVHVDFMRKPVVQFDRSQSEDVPNIPQAMTTDDILDKYRKKHTSVHGDVTDSKEADDRADDEDYPPAYDSDNLENCQAFHDAKRKLRLVLGTADFNTLPWIFNTSSGSNRPMMIPGDNSEKRASDLISFLKVQLAEAINLQNKDLIAQLHETLRCLRQFDKPGTKKLLQSLQDDYKSRSPYIAYLVRSRQGLLTTRAHCERLLHRIQRDKEICHKYFVSVLVRLYLEKKEKHIQKLLTEFQKLTMSDEKTDLVEEFLEYLGKEMENDQIWQAASEQQIDDAQLAIERYVMGRIYNHAMFPNGDGDIMRDQILHEHIQKLSKGITPNNKYLRISRMYQQECPWPSAQAEIMMISAYKTPKDKLQCVLRCAAIIMNLLSIASDKSVPAADDFIPVQIYVLVKANPPNLLSTIQYVNSFYEKRLGGEEQYWWLQFSSAVEFMKTMD